MLGKTKATLTEIAALVAGGESEQLELKQSTGQHFGIKPEELAHPHESKPWNPHVANVFYRAGVIEHWGTGTIKIRDWCRDNGNPPPSWTHNEHQQYVTATFWPVGIKGAAPAGVALSVEAQVEAQVNWSEMDQSVLETCAHGVASAQELLSKVGYDTRTGNFKRSLEKLLGQHLVEMTIPDKPNSRLQRYRLTQKGRALLAKGGQAREAAAGYGRRRRAGAGKARLVRKKPAIKQARKRAERR